MTSARPAVADLAMSTRSVHADPIVYAVRASDLNRIAGRHLTDAELDSLGKALKASSGISEALSDVIEWTVDRNDEDGR